MQSKTTRLSFYNKHHSACLRGSRTLLLLVALTMLSACGQRGPLYLPNATTNNNLSKTDTSINATVTTDNKTQNVTNEPLIKNIQTNTDHIGQISDDNDY